MRGSVIPVRNDLQRKGANTERQQHCLPLDRHFIELLCHHEEEHFMHITILFCVCVYVCV